MSQSRHNDAGLDDDCIVITPPKNPPLVGFKLGPESQEDGKGVYENEHRKEDRNLRTVVLGSADFDRKYKSKSLSASRSCTDITEEFVDGTTVTKKAQFHLQLPMQQRKARRSLSAEFGKLRLSAATSASDPKARKSKSSQCTPQMARHGSAAPRHGRSVSRTRSSSPVMFSAMRLRVKATSPGDSSSDDGKSGWPRNLRLFSRKPVSAPTTATVNAHKEFVWQDQNNASVTSDGTDSVDMIFANNSPADVWQSENEAMETAILPAYALPFGGSAGPTAAGNGTSGDVPDGQVTAIDMQRNKAIEHLQQKILKISEQIKIEQLSRDDNVTEYLKLAKDADKQQAARIKSVFEKKNQKSKGTVTQLQKKLETYHRRLKDIESSGASKLQNKYGLKDMGAKLTDFSGGVVDSVKGSLSGLSQVTQNAAGAIVSKPKDFASKLKNKFGSVDNITGLKDDEDGSDELNRCNSADDVSVSTSGSADYPMHPQNGVSHPHIQLQPQIIFLKNQLINVQQQVSHVRELEQQQEKMKNEMEQLRSQVQRDIGLLTNSLQDERFRCERLEDQLHDLSEMHHRELSDIKQDLASLEEKLEYHSQERARDIQEALESCQTRISKMEVQQHHQHQQLVTMEGVENATARALLGKLINLLLSVLAVILVFVSTVSSIVMPFFRSQTRMILTVGFVVFLAVLYRNWEPWSTYVTDLWSGR